MSMENECAEGLVVNEWELAGGDASLPVPLSGTDTVTWADTE